MCHTHFLYLRNGWADNVLIRYVVGDGSTDRFPEVIRGTFASQRTCNAHPLVHRQQGVLLVLCLDPAFLELVLTLAAFVSSPKINSAIWNISLSLASHWPMSNFIQITK